MTLAFLLLSILTNVFLGWYIYRLILRHSETVVLIKDIKYKIDFFKNHILNLHELPMFYGEPTLQNLISHSKELVESFNNFEKDFLFLSEGEEQEDDL